MLRLIARQASRSIPRCRQLSKELLRQKSSSVPKTQPVVEILSEGKGDLSSSFIELPSSFSADPVINLPLIQIGDYVEAFR